MICKYIFVFLLLSLVTNIVFCQSFTFSNGLGAGKRAVAEFPSYTEFSSNDDFANNDLKRLKMLMHRFANEKPLLNHCDPTNILKKIIRMENPVPQFHLEKTQNTDY